MRIGRNIRADENGTWWYYPQTDARHRRFRVTPKNCGRCGQEFVSANWRRQEFCSQVCNNTERRGPKSRAWRGGVSRHTTGYLVEYVPDDDPLVVMRDASGYCLQHRLVMARLLGRPLRRGEQVHHVNGVKTDNRAENLQLRQRSHGTGAAFRCSDCGSHNVEPAHI